MNSFSSLPPQIQRIIETNCPIALKLISDQTLKQTALGALEKHVTNKSVPKSIQLKTALIFPKSLQNNAEDKALNAAATTEFKELMTTFQSGATILMRTIAERALEATRLALKTHLTNTETELVNFYLKVLRERYPDEAAPYETFFTEHGEDSFVTETENERVKIGISYVTEWRKYLNDALDKKAFEQVEAEANKSKKKTEKNKVADIIADDNNNQLVADLVNQQIDKKLKPLKITINNLNVKRGDQSKSPRKQNDSSSKPSVSFQQDQAPKDRRKGTNRPPSPASSRGPSPNAKTNHSVGPAAGKGEQRGRGKQRRKDDDRQQSKSASRPRDTSSKPNDRTSHSRSKSPIAGRLRPRANAQSNSSGKRQQEN